MTLLKIIAPISCVTAAGHISSSTSQSSPVFAPVTITTRPEKNDPTAHRKGAGRLVESLLLWNAVVIIGDTAVASTTSALQEFSALRCGKDICISYCCTYICAKYIRSKSSELCISITTAADHNILRRGVLLLYGGTAVPSSSSPSIPDRSTSATGETGTGHNPTPRSTARLGLDTADHAIARGTATVPNTKSANGMVDGVGC